MGSFDWLDKYNKKSSKLPKYDKYTGFDTSTGYQGDPYQKTLSNSYRRPQPEPIDVLRGIWSRGYARSGDALSWLDKYSGGEVQEQQNIDIDRNFFNNREIQELQSKFQQAGIQAPASPFEKPKEKEPNLFFRILNKLALPGYASMGGIYNILDDDKETGFWEGVGDGIDAGWNNTGKGKSGSDLLKMMKESDTAWKSALSTGTEYINPITFLGKGIEEVTGYEGIENFGKGLTGFGLDIVTDPTSYLSAPLTTLLKGSKVAKGAMMTVDDAIPIVQRVAKNFKYLDDTFDAGRLAKGTARSVNRMNNVPIAGEKGLRWGLLGQKQIVDEATLRQFADKTGIPKVYNAIDDTIKAPFRKAIEKNPDGIIGTTQKLGLELGDKFSNASLKAMAHSDTDKAGQLVLQKTMNKLNQTTREKHLKGLQQLGKKLSDMLEGKDQEEFIDIIENLTELEVTEITDEARSTAIKKTKQKLQDRIELLEKQLDEYKADNMKINPSYDANKEQIAKLKSMMGEVLQAERDQKALFQKAMRDWEVAQKMATKEGAEYVPFEEDELAGVMTEDDVAKHLQGQDKFKYEDLDWLGDKEYTYTEPLKHMNTHDEKVSFLRRVMQANGIDLSNLRVSQADTNKIEEIVKAFSKSKEDGISALERNMQYLDGRGIKARSIVKAEHGAFKEISKPLKALQKQVKEYREKGLDVPQNIQDKIKELSQRKKARNDRLGELLEMNNIQLNKLDRIVNGKNIDDLTSNVYKTIDDEMRDVVDDLNMQRDGYVGDLEAEMRGKETNYNGFDNRVPEEPKKKPKISHDERLIERFVENQYGMNVSELKRSLQNNPKEFDEIMKDIQRDINGWKMRKQKQLEIDANTKVKGKTLDGEQFEKQLDNAQPKILDELAENNKSNIDNVVDYEPENFTSINDVPRNIFPENMTPRQIIEQLPTPIKPGGQAEKGIKELLEKAGLGDVYDDIQKMDINRKNLNQWKKSLKSIIDNPDKKTVKFDDMGKHMPQLIEDSVGKGGIDTALSNLKNISKESYDIINRLLAEGKEIDISSLNIDDTAKKNIQSRLDERKHLMTKVDKWIFNKDAKSEELAKLITETRKDLDMFDDNVEKVFKKYNEGVELDDMSKEIVKKRPDWEELKKHIPEEYREPAKLWLDSMENWGKTEQEWGLLKEGVLDHRYVPHEWSDEVKKIDGQKKDYNFGHSTMENDKSNLVDPSNKHDMSRSKGTIKSKNKDAISKLKGTVHEGKLEKFYETNAVKLFLKRGIDHGDMMYTKQMNDITLKLFGTEMQMMSKNGKLVPKLIDKSPVITENLLSKLKELSVVKNDEYWNIIENYQIDEETLNSMYKSKNSNLIGIATDYTDNHVGEYSGGYKGVMNIDRKATNAMGNTYDKKSKDAPNIIKQIINNNKVTDQSGMMMDKINKGEYVMVFPEGQAKNVEVNGVIPEDELVEAGARGIEQVPIDELQMQNLIKVDLDSMQRMNLQSGEVPVYALPRQVYAQIKATTEQQFKKDRNVFLSLFDRFTSLWKANATLSPGFHGRNAMSNVFQNFLGVGKDALDPKIHRDAIRVLRAGAEDSKTGLLKNKELAEQVIKLGDQEMTYKEVHDMALKLGLLDHNMMDIDVRGFAKSKVDELMPPSTLSKANPLDSKNFKLYDVSRNFGSGIESEAKMVNFISHLKRGYTPEESMEMVNKFLFDYTDLTEFEKNFMKRAVPFYTWMRKNIPLQVDQLMNNQAPYRLSKKAIDNFNQDMPEEDRQFLPDFLDGWINLGKNKDGSYRMQDTNLPFEDLNKVTSPKELMSGINPYIKLLLEQGLNRNIYFGNEIESYEGQVKESNILADALPENIVKMLGGGKKDGKTMLPSRQVHAMNTLLPQVRTLDRLVTMGNLQDARSEMGIKQYNWNVDWARDQGQQEYLDQLIALSSRLKALGIDLNNQPKKKEQKSVEDIIANIFK